MVVVSLHAFPTRLFKAFDEAAEGLLRDYLLTALSGGQPFTPADVALAREAKALVARAVNDPQGSGTIRMHVAEADAATFGVLQAVLDHANLLAYDGTLLALPVLPEIAALRNWICDQVSSQTSGGPATPWQLPVDPATPGVPPAKWPRMQTLPPDQAWLAGDDTNVIIGASRAALDLLGWDNLTGERILAVIPPEHREAHLAAFTRGVVSNEHRLLDQPLFVEALTRDGRRVPITMTLTCHPGDGGRQIYLANLEARTPTDGSRSDDHPTTASMP